MNTFHQIQSKLDQLVAQLRHTEMSLRDKICKEKQKYFTLWSHYKELQSKKEPSQAMLDTSQQEEVEELQTSQLVDVDTMTELTKLQLIMEDVTTSLAKVEVIKKYWSGGKKVSEICLLLFPFVCTFVSVLTHAQRLIICMDILSNSYVIYKYYCILTPIMLPNH